MNPDSRSDAPMDDDGEPSISAMFGPRIEALEATLAEISESIVRLNRTQFKANALAETQAKQADEAIALARSQVEQRDRETREAVAASDEEFAEMRSIARLELVIEFLPALDGIESALASGRLVRERRAVRERQHGRTFRARIARALRASAAVPDEDGAAIDGWLEGLALVRERLLGVLAGEGVTPTGSADSRFDPRLHVAVATRVSPRAVGRVVEVVRAGYVRGSHVVRYAEVVVGVGAGEPGQPLQDGGESSVEGGNP